MDIIFKLEHGNEKVTNFRIAEAIVDTCNDCHPPDLNAEVIARMILLQIDTAEVIHAKWIINSDGYYPYCSNCKHEPESDKMSKYCPECGAKMDKE